jgi:hypothetical protein
LPSHAACTRISPKTIFVSLSSHAALPRPALHANTTRRSVPTPPPPPTPPHPTPCTPTLSSPAPILHYSPCKYLSFPPPPLPNVAGRHHPCWRWAHTDRTHQDTKTQQPMCALESTPLLAPRSNLFSTLCGIIWLRKSARGPRDHVRAGEAFSYTLSLCFHCPTASMHPIDHAHTTHRRVACRERNRNEAHMGGRAGHGEQQPNKPHALHHSPAPTPPPTKPTHQAAFQSIHACKQMSRKAPEQAGDAGITQGRVHTTRAFVP